MCIKSLQPGLYSNTLYRDFHASSLFPIEMKQRIRNQHVLYFDRKSTYKSLLFGLNHDSQTHLYVLTLPGRLEISQVKQNHVSTVQTWKLSVLHSKIEISDCNEFGFFGQLLDVYRKIFLTSLITSQNKAIRFCFFPYPAATMLVCKYSSMLKCLHAS